MSVRVFGSSVVHRWAATDPKDRRIAWTFCGIRFCWGRLPSAPTGDDRCTRCW